MASPSKNLIDATNLSSMSRIVFVKPQVIIDINYLPKYVIKPINTLSTNNRWDLTTVCSKRNTDFLIPIPTLTLNRARNANIVTFPAAYKERGATSNNTGQSRPSEGQLWPRGVCGNSITITDASVSYSFSSSTEWLQTHSFGHNPIVEVVDSNGAEVWAEVTFPTITQVRVQFSEPIAGTLTLS